MVPPLAKFDGPTRGQILALLRRGQMTVDELAQAIGVTDNAVRMHLTALERDGLARAVGVRREGNVGKPATLYAVPPEADAMFSKAYEPVLSTLLVTLTGRLGEGELTELLRDVGRQLAVSTASTDRSGLRVVDATAIAYRLYDIGYEVDLDRASALFAPDAATRERPARNEAQALQISNPPLFVALGAEYLTIDGAEHRAEVSARLFDFGTCSLQLRVAAPAALSWDAFTSFGNAVDASPALAPIFTRHLESLRARVAPAVERPNLASVVEDYVVFRITGLTDERGKSLGTDVLTDEHIVPLLLRERRGLSLDARRELLPHRFSYYADDLTILTWDNALVVEARGDDRDVEYILEFANAQLLELRFYDAVLDAELPAMYDRITATRGRISALPTWRYRPLLARLQTRVADVTETVERVENALKVTDD